MTRKYWSPKKERQARWRSSFDILPGLNAGVLRRFSGKTLVRKGLQMMLVYLDSRVDKGSGELPIIIPHVDFCYYSSLDVNLVPASRKMLYNK